MAASPTTLLDGHLGPSGGTGETREATRRRWAGFRDRSPLLSVYVLSCLFYLWTTTSTGHALDFGAAQTDDYNQLTNGFLRGELSISTLPPKGLLALKNPYDPAQNFPYNAPIHDLALYHGHLYLTWGPTPVVTLFLPWRLLHVGGIPQGFAIWLYCAVGLGCSMLLLKYLADRFLPNVRTWQLVIGSIALAGSNLAAFLLRSPDVYEVNVASSLCFAMAGAYLLASGGLGRLRPSRLAAGSLCVGLAAAGREDDVVLGLLVLVVFGLILRRDRPITARVGLRLAIVALGPFLLVGVLLIAYNVARFGSPLQFGSQYQLALFNPQTTQYYQLGYIAPSLYGYLIDPIRWTLGFPYFMLPAPYHPTGAPKAYAPETMGGILTSTPIVLGLFALPFMLRRRRLTSELAWFVTALTTCAGLLVLAISFSIPGGSTRYEADFASLLIVPALLVWYAFCDTDRGLRRRLAKVLGTALALYGALVGTALSTTGYFAYNQKEYPDLETSDPNTYWRLDQLTSIFPTAVTLLIGRPVVSRIADIDGVSAQLGLVNIDDGKNLFFYLSPSPATIEVVAPGSSRSDLIGGFSPGPASPRGAEVVVHWRTGRTTRLVVYRPGLVSLPITLHLGLNRISVWATLRGPRHVAAGPFVQVYKFSVKS
ncbi:MAG: hypothetical protein JWO62_575 [Acidimicrobiaceae bacterium]|nr:hypothetical protein [Acidimicrobiaceae bacterium]